MTPPKLELGKRRRSLKVELGERAYPIRIGWDTLPVSLARSRSRACGPPVELPMPRKVA